MFNQRYFDSQQQASEEEMQSVLNPEDSNIPHWIPKNPQLAPRSHEHLNESQKVIEQQKRFNDDWPSTNLNSHLSQINKNRDTSNPTSRRRKLKTHRSKNIPKNLGHPFRKNLLRTTKEKERTAAVNDFIDAKGDTGNADFTLERYDRLFKDHLGNRLAKSYFWGVEVIQDIAASNRARDKKHLVQMVGVFVRGVDKKELKRLH